MKYVFNKELNLVTMNDTTKVSEGLTPNSIK